MGSQERHGFAFKQSDASPCKAGLADSRRACHEDRDAVFGSDAKPFFGVGFAIEMVPTAVDGNAMEDFFEIGNGIAVLGGHWWSRRIQLLSHA